MNSVSRRMTFAAIVGAFAFSAAGAMAQPTAELLVIDADDPRITVERTGANAEKNLFLLKNTGTTNFAIENQKYQWSFGQTSAGTFRINRAGSGIMEMAIAGNGVATFSNTVNCGGAGCVNPSSRELKTDFEAVDEEAVLAKLVSLPMRTWRYKKTEGGSLHMGAVAEEFQQAFGLSDGKYISTIDADGVTMAAVKGLHKKLERKERELVALREQNEDFAVRLARLESTLSDNE